MNESRNHIRGFLEKYRVARQANSREIRLTIGDAEQLSIALGMLLSSESELRSQVMDLQQQILSAEVRQDGGGF